MRRILTLAALALLAGCVSPPAESVGNVDDRPALMVANAAPGSRLFVDGLDMGPVGNGAMAADADRPVLIEPGTHLVKVVGPSGGSYAEKVFVSGRGTRTLTVPAGAAP
jgi:hypothetical protein